MRKWEINFDLILFLNITPSYYTWIQLNIIEEKIYRFNVKKNPEIWRLSKTRKTMALIVLKSCCAEQRRF